MTEGATLLCLKANQGLHHQTGKHEGTLKVMNVLTGTRGSGTHFWLGYVFPIG